MSGRPERLAFRAAAGGAVLAALAGALCGCALSVQRTGYAKPEGEARVCRVSFASPKEVPNRDSLPKLGSAKVRDGGFTFECAESDALAALQSEACGLGANLAVITWRKGPDIWSNCFRADAELRKAPDSTAARLEAGYYAPDSVAARSARQERTQWIQLWSSLAVGLLAGWLIVHFAN